MGMHGEGTRKAGFFMKDERTPLKNGDRIKSVGMLQCCFCHWIGRYHLQNHQGSLGHGLVPMCLRIVHILKWRELIYYCDKYYNVLSWTEIVRKFNSLFPSLGIYAFGLFATDIFVNAGQVVTGNLAPHFLALCKPNYTALGCKQYTQFISSAHACTGNPDLIMKARKTFPSKEAALSIYAAMYLAVSILYCLISLYFWENIDSSYLEGEERREGKTAIDQFYVCNPSMCYCESSENLVHWT